MENIEENLCDGDYREEYVRWRTKRRICVMENIEENMRDGEYRGEFV